MAIKLNIGGVVIEMEQDKFSEAIEKGELSIETDKLIPKTDDMIVYKKDDFETFKTNFANEEYKKGKVAGEEMTIKEGREKYGLDFEGKKLENFAEALKKKALDEAKVEPSKKIQELQTENEGLKTNYKTLEEQFSTFKNQQTERELRTKKDSALLGFLPKTGLKVKENITLLALKNEAGIDIDFQDGKTVVIENGQVVKDQKTFDPIDPSIFITEKINALGLIEKPSGGGSGGDEGAGGSKSGYDAFVKEMKANDIEEGTEKFNQEMNKRIREKTLDM